MAVKKASRQSSSPFLIVVASLVTSIKLGAEKVGDSFFFVVPFFHRVLLLFALPSISKE